MTEQGNQNQQYNTNTPFQQDPSVIKLKLQVDEIIQEIYLQLSGLEWSEEHQGYTRQREQMINPRGVDFLMMTIKPMVSRVAMLSNLDKDMILSIAKTVEEDIADVLVTKLADFEVDEAYLDTIVDIIGNAVLFTLMRSEGGFEQKQMQGMVKSVESHTVNNQPTRSSLGSIFKR